MNNWNITGRLAADAEVKFSGNGDPIVGFRVAVDAGFGDKKTTLWVRCTGFGKRFEKLAAYLTKGGLIAVNGEITGDHWVGKDGSKNPQLELRVSDITLLGGKSDAPAKPAAAGKPQGKPAPEFDEQDIPF